LSRAASILEGAELLPEGGEPFVRIVDSNMSAIADAAEATQIGAAFFPALSFLNHGCVPNVQYRTRRKAGVLLGQLVALVDLRPGDELRKDYANNGHEVLIRHESDIFGMTRRLHPSVHYQMSMVLAETFRFRCDCAACMDCVVCGRPGNTHCSQCGVLWCSTKCKWKDDIHADVCEELAEARKRIRVPFGIVS